MQGWWARGVRGPRGRVRECLPPPLHAVQGRLGEGGVDGEKPPPWVWPFEPETQDLQVEALSWKQCGVWGETGSRHRQAAQPFDSQHL